MKILRSKWLNNTAPNLPPNSITRNQSHLHHEMRLLPVSEVTAAAPFNCILTDPPYEIEAESFDSQAAKGTNTKDNWIYALSCYTALPKRVSALPGKMQRSTFCDINRFAAIKVEFMSAGWDVWPVPLIWGQDCRVSPRPDAGPTRTYEAILMATKGNPPFHKTGAPDVIVCPQRKEMAFGVEKPVDLYVELLCSLHLQATSFSIASRGPAQYLPLRTGSRSLPMELKSTRSTVWH